jgi:cell division protein FtsB
LVGLLVLLHGQLWLGRGSLPKVRVLREQLAQQERHNQQSTLDNEQLGAEVRDLKEGLEMVEERARHDLGMVKPNEIYVQVAQRPLQ